MAMSDCEMCWSTPCTCGHEWEKKSNGQLIEMIDMLNRILKEKMPLDENVNKQAAGGDTDVPSLPVDVEIELYNEVCDWYSNHRHMFQTSKYYGLEIEHELFWLVTRCIASLNSFK